MNLIQINEMKKNHFLIILLNKECLNNKYLFFNFFSVYSNLVNTSIGFVSIIVVESKLKCFYTSYSKVSCLKLFILKLIDLFLIQNVSKITSISKN